MFLLFCRHENYNSSKIQSLSYVGSSARLSQSRRCVLQFPRVLAAIHVAVHGSLEFDPRRQHAVEKGGIQSNNKKRASEQEVDQSQSVTMKRWCMQTTVQH